MSTRYEVTCPACKVGMDRIEPRATVREMIRDDNDDDEWENCAWSVVLYRCPKCENAAHVEEDIEEPAEAEDIIQEGELEPPTRAGKLEVLDRLGYGSIAVTPTLSGSTVKYDGTIGYWITSNIFPATPSVPYPISGAGESGETRAEDEGEGAEP